MPLRTRVMLLSRWAVWQKTPSHCNIPSWAMRSDIVFSRGTCLSDSAACPEVSSYPGCYFRNPPPHDVSWASKWLYHSKRADSRARGTAEDQRKKSTRWLTFDQPQKDIEDPAYAARSSVVLPTEDKPRKGPLS